MTFKSIIAVATLSLGLANVASAQCDGSDGIPSNDLINSSWDYIQTGDMDALFDRLTENGVANPALENGFRSLKGQRPDGYPECTVLLRSHISDRLVREWVVFGENGGLGFFATLTVATLAGNERIISFNLDTSIDPAIYSH